MTSKKRKTYHIPFAPVSLNQAYSTRVMRKGKKTVPIRYLQPAYRKFKDTVKEQLEQQGPLGFEPPFAISFLFLMEKSSFFFKNGNTRKSDVSDYFKLVEDACAEHWEVDDCHNFIVVGHKRWVDDGELKDFVEDAYKSPPHKNLKATIQIVVAPLDETFAKWDGKLVPDLGVLDDMP